MSNRLPASRVWQPAWFRNMTPFTGPFFDHNMGLARVYQSAVVLSPLKFIQRRKKEQVYFLQISRAMRRPQLCSHTQRQLQRKYSPPQFHDNLLATLKPQLLRSNRQAYQ